MSLSIPDYLTIPSSELAVGTTVAVRVVDGMPEVARAAADDMLTTITSALKSRERAAVIVPVGPVDQYPLLAEAVNQRALSLSKVLVVNMDEYLTDDDAWIPEDHPLSFRGYMNRAFYELVDPSLRPPPDQRVFPDPSDPQKIQHLIDAWGGVDACFGGIGINGHIAFNEPPQPGEHLSDEQFRHLPTRVLSLACETRAINANTVGGSLEVVPRRCVTVGMREILAARALRFYCNRPWQSAVVRRVLHGPVSARCPASFLRTHADARLTLASYVAAAPDVRLR